MHVSGASYKSGREDDQLPYVLNVAIVLNSVSKMTVIFNPDSFLIVAKVVQSLSFDFRIHIYEVLVRKLFAAEEDVEVVVSHHHSVAVVLQR